MASRLTVLYGPSGVGQELAAARGRGAAAADAGSGGRRRADDGAEVVIVDSWRDDPLLAVGRRRRRPHRHSARRRARGTGDARSWRRALPRSSTRWRSTSSTTAATVGRSRARSRTLLTRPELPVHVLLGVRDDSLADLDALQAPPAGPVRQRPAARPPDPGRRALGDRRAAARVRGARRAGGDGRERARRGGARRGCGGRIEQQPNRTWARRRRNRARRVEAPYLQLVLERLWEVEREQGSNALRAATLDELGGAERIVEEHLERALARPRRRGARSGRAALQPPRDAVRDEDRPRRRRPGAVRTGGAGRARARARAPRCRPDPPARPRPERRAAALRDLPRRARAADPRLARPARGRASLERERAAARRRHRRIAAVAAAALIALAATTALAAWALSQRSEAREQAAARRPANALRQGARARARALCSRSARDPERGARARARARRASAPVGVDRGRAASGAARVPRADGGAARQPPVSDLVALPGGTLAAVTARRRRPARRRRHARPRRRRPAARRPDLARRPANALTLRGTPADGSRRLPGGAVVANRPGAAGHALRGVPGPACNASSSRAAWRQTRDRPRRARARCARLPHPALRPARGVQPERHC